MYDLVADIEAYPQFVPLCQRLSVKSVQQEGEQKIIVADMTVAYKVLRETFTSRVLLNPIDLTIRTEAIAGPFREMQNIWAFTENGEKSCDVKFSLDYEFRSRAIQLLVGGLFDRAFRKYATAFESRADDVYGRVTL